MSNLSIEEIHNEKTGKVSDKWSSYLPLYDEFFKEFRTKRISLLEIGVQNGGSLETWMTYFINAFAIVGCDIDKKCMNLQYEDKRVYVVVGDVNNIDTTTNILKISSNFDLIIDDGSHMSNDILNSFLIYFPFIRPGGLYVIEDAHTLYMNGAGGGVLNEISAYYFFKKLVDVISIQFWGNELSIDVYFRTFFPVGLMPLFIKEGWIESIEFRNSMIIIRKSLDATHEKLGSRLITGNIAQVNNEVLKIRK